MEMPGQVEVGTKVVIQLREKDKAEFGASHQLKRLIKKYSNFVGFPISVDVSAATVPRRATTVPVPAAPPCDTCVGGDNGIDHHKN
jgi:HSP90 family molecular chaperone